MPRGYIRDKRSNRGFMCYVRFTDLYEAKVQVTESSSATREALWIFVEGGGITNNNGSVHMSIRQAKEVRDAINRWLKDIEG